MIELGLGRKWKGQKGGDRLSQLSASSPKPWRKMIVAGFEVPVDEAFTR